MDEKLLATLGVIWAILNLCYINSCILQEASELQRTLVKTNPSTPCDETISTQTILGLGMGSYALFTGLLAMIRAYHLSIQTNRPAENAEQRINNLPRNSFFQDRTPNTSITNDNSSSEDEEQINTPKKVN